MNRKKLSDILRGSDRDQLSRAWESTEAAQDFAPLPGGEYVARITEGSASAARTGTPGYKLTFEVLEGEYAGRRFWHDLWLTAAALPMTKRDLAKLRVTRLDQLERPLPQGIRCRVRLALRTEDDGRRYNRVRSFEVLAIEPPEPDPFAPREAGTDPGGQEEQPAVRAPALEEGGVAA